MNVLIIPEDFRNDQYVLKPIVEAMLRFLGHRSKVRVLTDPLMGGVDEALDHGNLNNVFDMYEGMVELFLLCIDRDCNGGRATRIQAAETFASHRLQAGKRMLGVAAMQEIEVWALAGIPVLPAAWSWQAVLAECHPKETYFEPYAKNQGIDSDVGGGRRILGLQAGANYRRVRQLCNGDVAVLEARI